MIARIACTAWRAVAVVALCIAARDAAAQASPGLASVAGRVVAGGVGDEMRPVRGTWVALNRVGSDSAGVIDSVRTAADGSYRFEYRRFGDPAAIYFTDAIYQGVGYFTDPLRGLNVSGEAADLIVFDTISTAAGARSMLRLRGRHFVVGPPTPRGRRPIVEVFELTNDTAFTIVPRSDTEPVWSTQLLPGAEDAEVGDGDVSATVVHFRRGRAELHTPIAPGLRQLSVHYTVPGSTFPLTLTLPEAPELLEVLIAGTDGAASGAGLHAEAAAMIEGEPYERFLSPRAAAGDEVVITVGRSLANRLAVPAAIGVTVLVLGGALVYARRTTYPSVDN